MGKILDLTGMRFGRLKAIKYIGKDKHNNARWECVCDCGNNIVTTCNNLKRGNTKSCGCYNKDRLREINIKYTTI